jgi:hypothetical protein
MASLFQTLEYEAFRKGITPRTQESREWFRKRLQQIRRVDRKSLMNDEPVLLNNRQIIGSMCMFFYDPKHKEVLPFYDRFPLTIVVGPAAGGFYGLNLHYLPPTLRARFLDGLMETASNNRYDDTTKFKISYDYMQKASKMKYFKPCFKHYLSEQVRSRFAFVPAPEWEIATFLPSADFAKVSTREVYRSSRSMI